MCEDRKLFFIYNVCEFFINVCSRHRPLIYLIIELKIFTTGNHFFQVKIFKFLKVKNKKNEAFALINK